MPSVSDFAARFVDDDSDEPINPECDAAFRRHVAARQREANNRQGQHGTRAARWAVYAIVSFLIATHVPGWWSFFAWCSTMLWGVGAIFSLEAANVERIVSTLEPDP